MRAKLIFILLVCVSLRGNSFDLAATSMVSPSSGCYLSANTTVTVIVANVTPTPFAGTFNMTYSLNGGPPVIEPVTTFLPASGTYIYSFIVKANLSSCQMHTLDVLVDLTGDTNPLNNSLSISVASDCDAVSGTIVYPDTVCSGINNGSLSLTGYNGNIQNWVFSDTGGAPWNWTGNTTDVQSYTNIAVPEQWWAIVTSPFGYCANDTTSIITIETSPQSYGGDFPADFNICDNGNGGQIDITGYVGTILDWEISTDGGFTWSSLGNTTDSLDYLNLGSTTLYQVLVQNDFCPAVYSAPLTLTLVPGTIAGSLPADFTICDNGNGGPIDLTGNLGNVLNWEISVDNGATWTPIWNTSTTLNYLNLTDTTMYQVQVQNGSCPPEYTAPVTLTLIPGSNAGSIAGPSVVCHYVNDTTWKAQPVTGNVLEWIYSLDNGLTWINTGSNALIYGFPEVSVLTIFGAIVQEGTCYADTAFTTVVVMPVGISAGPDVTITEGDTTQLVAFGGVSFFWDPVTDLSNPFIASPLAFPLVTTTYAVQVTDINGCSDTAFVTVVVDPLVVVTDVVIPNLITPNGDGFNDHFQIGNLAMYPDNELIVFNGYGEVIFQSAPYNNDWDGTFAGTKVPDGTYYYVLNLNDTTLGDQTVQGVLTILGKR